MCAVGKLFKNVVLKFNLNIFKRINNIAICKLRDFSLQKILFVCNIIIYSSNYLLKNVS